MPPQEPRNCPGPSGDGADHERGDVPGRSRCRPPRVSRASPRPRTSGRSARSSHRRGRARRSPRECWRSYPRCRRRAWFPVGRAEQPEHVASRGPGGGGGRGRGRAGVSGLAVSSSARGVLGRAGRGLSAWPGPTEAGDEFTAGIGELTARAVLLVLAGGERLGGRPAVAVRWSTGDGPTLGAGAAGAGDGAAIVLEGAGGAHRLPRAGVQRLGRRGGGTELLCHGEGEGEQREEESELRYGSVHGTPLRAGARTPDAARVAKRVRDGSDRCHAGANPTRRLPSSD